MLGSAIVRNTGTVTQTGNVGVGNTPTGTASIVNAAGGTWSITTDALIANDSLQATFVNDGTLIKSGGTGLSVIRPAVSSSQNGTGHVIAASGLLDLARSVSGHEALEVRNGATLILEGGASSDTAFAFGDSGGTLQLNDGDDYHGSITHFTAADMLDVRSVGFSGQSATYKANVGSSGTLTFSDGKHAVALTLVDNYTKDSFHLTSDKAGGTLITIV